MRVCLLRNRLHASVGNLAHYVLELDGGVVNVKKLEQLRIDLLQDGIAGRKRQVSNQNVAGERVRFRAQAPNVQIVHAQHAFHCADSGSDLLELHAARRAFQQDV